MPLSIMKTDKERLTCKHLPRLRCPTGLCWAGGHKWFFPASLEWTWCPLLVSSALKSGLVFFGFVYPSQFTRSGAVCPWCICLDGQHHDEIKKEIKHTTSRSSVTADSTDESRDKLNSHVLTNEWMNILSKPNKAETMTHSAMAHECVP